MAYESLLNAEPDVSGIAEAAGGIPPEAMEAPVASELGQELGVPPGGGELDLDAILASIESSEEPALQEEATAQPSAGDLADLLAQVRSGQTSVDSGEEVDALQERLMGIESRLQRLNQEKQALAVQKTRDNIQSAITTSISDELQRLSIDPKKGPGKAFSRIVSNSAMVAVAREQARTGRQDVDLRSVSQTVENYSKLITRVAHEIAAQMQSNQRSAPRGGQKQPFTPSKAPGEMTENEFDSAVMAAFQTMLT